ncbi:3,4-dihydroxy 2-butanone 4-phosphate synthase [Candidatus Kinetoplastibacterium blastocrithidii TCC012E]|uniref:3,4-dihydroxy-2-butanone 4-phosphate synthase n=1 Tax=Candidatus Kinetoplastidibacterium blastocrithidiae TCC012E TaxID=1208922 RepID=M1M3H9_9PROT|nr:3,4-dihydroxy-2-butanone-4-phosphate synthase [Candidatus Kinetoplastibacterium blastocrithidii]AFZ83586.1 3,4-dihydroxy 2-butanone 4-phosphate synthase [Candidatus Kinetoplastibacterium blastocrithidii (ex Strigomonas culicis)]AGF49704.1 3,4-dihydroxy 2-butanone 4-phosphate synthase [Candidatus Kinetoplastibacterium blastocrithidii TCC012E]
MSLHISSILELINELQSGRMIILVDEEDRENEGDLLIASEFVSSEAINFMVTHGRGLVCITLTHEHCSKLGLSMMSDQNRSRYGTNFTQSIEAAHGIDTGISASDRARTIRVAVSPNATPDDIVQPGHIFPLRAVTGGVLVRAGHTEAGCDLTAIAGLIPSSVICEILNDDGKMARLPDLIKFSQKHNIKIGAISDLIKYRIQNETIVRRIGQFDIETIEGTFKAVFYKDLFHSKSLHIALVSGDPRKSKETLVHVYESISILNIINLNEKPLNFNDVLKNIANSSSGVIVLINCESVEGNMLDQVNKILNLEGANNANSDSINGYSCGISDQILYELGVGVRNFI